MQFMPIIVRDVSDELTLQHALVENLHRDDLNPLEEAAAYQQLIEDFNMTQEAVAHRVGKSRSGIANLLRLFQLPPQIQRMVADGQVSAGHAKALLATPDRALQETLARRIVSEGMTVRETEEAIRQHNAPKGPGARPEPEGETPGSRLRAPGLLELEELLAEQLDTRVKINMGPKRGRVVIEFADLEDLERIYRVMAPSDQQPTHAS
jgi:ParB family chromosome partitioning protein